MKKYVQSVDGAVNLIGGAEVGLFDSISSGRVVVREAAGHEQIGWVDNGETYVPPPDPNSPEPTPPEIGPLLMDITLKQAELEMKLDAIGTMLVPTLPEV